MAAKPPSRFITFQIIHCGGGRAPFTHKVKVAPSETIREALCKLAKKYLSSRDGKAIGIDSSWLSMFIDNIASLKTSNQCDILEYLEESIEEMHDDATQLLGGMIKVKLNPLSEEQKQPAKKPKRNAFSLMMKGPPVQFLPIAPPDDDNTETIQEQISRKIPEVFAHAKLGYYDDSSKNALLTNKQRLVDVLCVVHAQWKKLFNHDFPALKKHAQVENRFLAMLGGCANIGTKKRKADTLTAKKLEIHINSLDRMDWTFHANFGCSKGPVESIDSDIEMIRELLFDQKIRIIGSQVRQSKGHQPSKPLAIFQTCDRDAIATVRSPGEQYAIVEAQRRKPPPKKGRVSQTMLNQQQGISQVTDKLQSTQPYDWIFLTDEDMRIPDFLGGRATTASDRASFRFRFRKRLAEFGLPKTPFALYGNSDSGQKQSVVALVRLPQSGGNRGSDFQVRIAASLVQIIQAMPKFLSKEDTKRINQVLRNATGVSKAVAIEIRKYITRDENNERQDEEKTKAAQELISQGLDGVTEELLQDFRRLNSRGNGESGKTSFDSFWSKCRQILHNHDGSAAHERRHTSESDATKEQEVLYCSQVRSIENLMEKATNLLKEDLARGTIEAMSPIPCSELVRLQFVPNNSFAATASKMTGRLGVIRRVQSRTLRDQHIDQHYVNAMTRANLEHCIAVKAAGLEARQENPNGLSEDNLHVLENLIVFVGQDDKCKIPIGDAVHLSTNVRYNNKAIVPVETANSQPTVNSGDHDWSCANVVPSVSLFGNIPADFSGSFYSGGKDTGTGEIEVVLRDATLDPSNVFDHTAQLTKSLRERGVPVSMLIQTDGGPDHNLTFVRTKLALFAMWVLLKFDQLTAIRGAPHGSYLNKVERCMSLLNLGLEHVATIRGKMPNWAEEKLKSCSTMKQVRAAIDAFETEKHEFLETHGANQNAASRTAAVPIPVGLVAGTTHAETVQNPELGVSIVRAEEARAQEYRGRNLRLEWKKAMDQPIQALSGRISELRLEGRPVLVKAKCTLEDINELHAALESVDPAYNQSIRLATDWSKVPLLKEAFEKHTVETPYSMSITKCQEADCKLCGPLRCPDVAGLQDLILERQPTPKEDPERPGHFLRREDNLAQFRRNGSKASDLTDLTALPSKNTGSVANEKDMAEKKLRDAKTATERNLNRWNASKVRATVTCWMCRKRRCVFSKEELQTPDTRTHLLRRIESSHFVCGTLLYQQDEVPMGQLLSQRISLRCTDPIERAYFNPKTGRAKFVTPDICFHCGNQQDICPQTELVNRALTDGKNCFPICRLCLDAKKKPVAKSGAKRHHSTSRKEKDLQNKRLRDDRASDKNNSGST